MTTTMCYGYKELQMTYTRTMGRALMYSSLLVLILVAAYHLAMFLQPEDVLIHTGKTIVIDVSKIPLPPPIGETQTVAVTAPGIKPSYGIPVPVPDGAVDPEQLFTPPIDIDPTPTNTGTIGDGTDGNTILVIPPEADPEPDVFRPFEEEPVPLLKPSPSYPELALRVNIEGTVWVKMLVTKDGSVKKAMVQKSDADIFNDAALEAAKRWTFRAALMNHRPVAVWVSIPFRFYLKK